VLAIQQQPNQWGSRHSTPYAYTQDVPLVMYGPGFINRGFVSKQDVTLADIAPTYADLLHFSAFPPRDGTDLKSALLPDARRNGLPRLIYTLVWDGVGWDALNRWSNSWPNLKNLMDEGANYTNATSGSSPSITPAIHATIGTGDFPKLNGISDVRMRVNGHMVDAEPGDSPRFLRVPTLADLWDAANNNLPVVGLMARDGWHLGMMGHGAFLSGGDKDIAVLDALGSVNFHTNQNFYSLPAYMQNGNPGLQEDINKVDQRDGQADQRWLGTPMLPYDGRVRYTPAWDIYETQRVEELLTKEHFGQDAMPDLFFNNYKSGDLAGHEWGMTTPQVRDDIAEQDAQLPIIVNYLNQTVGKDNYVLLITADHGMQPYPAVTGGWSINTEEMTADLQRRFDHTTPNTPLVMSNRGYQYVLDHKEMKRNNVTADEVAAFIRGYRIQDNVKNGATVPQAFQDKLNQRLFLTALTPPELKSAMECAKKKGVQALRLPHRWVATRARNVGLPTMYRRHRRLGS
jgi:arylsulfatase A-like enzyme